MEMDAPILNRHEKQLITYATILTDHHRALITQLKQWMADVAQHGPTDAAFPGFFDEPHDTQLSSLVYMVCHRDAEFEPLNRRSGSFGGSVFQRAMEQCKDELVWVASEDGIMRSRRSGAMVGGSTVFHHYHSPSQCHASLAALVSCMVDPTSAAGGRFKADDMGCRATVNTFSAATIVLPEHLQTQSGKRLTVHSLMLHESRSVENLRGQLQDFFEGGTAADILVIRCAHLQPARSFERRLLAMHCLQEARASALQRRPLMRQADSHTAMQNTPKHVIVVNHLLMGAKGGRYSSWTPFNERWPMVFLDTLASSKLQTELGVCCAGLRCGSILDALRCPGGEKDKSDGEGAGEHKDGELDQPEQDFCREGASSAATAPSATLLNAIRAVDVPSRLALTGGHVEQRVADLNRLLHTDGCVQPIAHVVQTVLDDKACSAGRWQRDVALDSRQLARHATFHEALVSAVLDEVQGILVQVLGLIEHCGAGAVASMSDHAECSNDRRVAAWARALASGFPLTAVLPSWSGSSEPSDGTPCRWREVVALLRDNNIAANLPHRPRYAYPFFPLVAQRLQCLVHEVQKRDTNATVTQVADVVADECMDSPDLEDLRTLGLLDPSMYACFMSDLGKYGLLSLSASADASEGGSAQWVLEALAAADGGDVGIGRVVVLYMVYHGVTSSLHRLQRTAPQLVESLRPVYCTADKSRVGVVTAWIPSGGSAASTPSMVFRVFSPRMQLWAELRLPTTTVNKVQTSC